MKEKLFEQNKNVYGVVMEKIKAKLSCIEGLHRKEEIGVLSEFFKRKLGRERVNDLYDMEEFRWRQKSRMREVKGIGTLVFFIEWVM